MIVDRGEHSNWQKRCSRVEARELSLSLTTEYCEHTHKSGKSERGNHVK